LYRVNYPNLAIVYYAPRKGLLGVTMPPFLAMRDSLALKLQRRGVAVWCHTVNNVSDYADLKLHGVFGIYTDSLGMGENEFPK